MKVDTSFSAQNLKMAQKPSFGAIHPTRYLIKNENGIFEQTADGELIKKLQRTIVGWLNKNVNDYNLRRQGKTPKAEAAPTKALRERLVRFCVNNDRDYSSRRLVRSFYADRPGGGVDSYIFSGNSIDIIDDVAKPIGQLRAAIVARTNVLRKEYGIKPENMKNYLVQEEEALSRAQSDYYHTIFDAVRNAIQPNKPENSVFDLFFTPVKKGKKVDYQLVNADFKRTMF